MNASDMGKKGAKKRWKGSTKAQRSEEMSRIAKLRWSERAAGAWVGEKARRTKKGKAPNG